MSQGARLEVPWKNKELTVEFASFRDKLTPGAKESFRVTVKDARGRPVEAGAAELLASMYDKSLDLFAPFHAPRALTLFPNWTSVSFPPLSANLAAAGPLWVRDESWVKSSPVEGLRGDSLVEISPYGVGGPGGRFGGRMYKRSSGRGVAVAEMSMMVDAAAQAPAPASAPAPQAAESRDNSGAPGEQDILRSAGPAPVALRANFAETAFWQPQLLTGADGSATIEFTVPDSVTSWRVWVAALSQTLASGYVEKNAESVKELMVRPYLPRFLREGDVARLKVVVNNAGEAALAGEATLEILDPETNVSLLAEFGLTAATARQPFRVEPGKGVDLTFPLTAPRRVGPTAFKVVARSGNLSDGELRPLPLLPSRIHLAQSRFVTLKGAERREMTFDDMRRSDPTRIDEQMVVTVDGQLFYSMLDALPYLIEYPYECTEQTLNRFVSTGMLSSLFDKYPAVARAAAEMARRDTPLERFDATPGGDPNLKMALEETPWLRESRGGDKSGHDFLRVLDPAVSRAQRDDALAKLAKAQLPNGGFPWFAGGPPSPHMTLYLMAGLARAAEFAVPVPREMVQNGWRYLAAEAKEDWLPRALKDDCCWELLTYLNYVASSYPDRSWTGDFLTDDDRRKILAFSFKHWREHQPLLKLQLALTLERMDRHKDAELVLASVMDSAKTTRDEGTFWQPEDRAWLWYNDRIETHAWALRTLMEVAPADPRRDGLVQWLFLNKKLNHWKSTRATAEVLYSLAAYLKATGTLAVREEATVEVANQTTTFVFEPDRFTGKKNQIVVPGAKLDAAKRPADATVSVAKTTPGLMFASATWHFSTEELPAESRSDLFGVERRYFKRVKSGSEVTLVPITGSTTIAVGDEVEVQLSLRAKAAAEYVHLRDPRPAGLEPDRPESGWKWDLGVSRYEETRDSGANFFFENLPAGEYTFKYRLRANLAGEFRSGPAQVQSIYAPERAAAIPIDGTPIDPALADVKSFKLTADGTRAIFLANLDEVGQFELYSVPVTGGSPTRLLLALHELIQDYRLSPTAEWMVIQFRNPVQTGNYDLYQAETDQASLPERINDSLDAPTERIWSWQLSPTGEHAVWISNEDGGTIDIFSHQLGGGGKHVLNGLLQAENVLAETGPNMPIVVSPDGNHVLFAMRSTTYPTHLTELYLAPVGGWPSNNGAPDFLGYDQPSGGRIEFSPDSNWIVYRSGSALVTRSTSGENGPCVISQSAVSPNQGFGYAVEVLDFAIHPDSQRTAYTALVTDTVSQESRGRGLFFTQSGGLDLITACAFGLNDSRPVWYDLSAEFVAYSAARSSGSTPRRADGRAPAGPARERRPTSGTCRRFRSRRGRASPAAGGIAARTRMSSTYQPSATVFDVRRQPEAHPRLGRADELGHGEGLLGPGRVGAVVGGDLGPGRAVVRRDFDVAEVVRRLGRVALPEGELDAHRRGEVERRRGQRRAEIVAVVAARAVGPRVRRTVRLRGRDRPRRLRCPAEVAALDVVVEHARVRHQREVLDHRLQARQGDAGGGRRRMVGGGRGHVVGPLRDLQRVGAGGGHGRGRERPGDDGGGERRAAPHVGHRALEERRRGRVDHGQEDGREGAPVVRIVAAAHVEQVPPRGEAGGVEGHGRRLDGRVEGAVHRAHRYRRAARPGRRVEVELGGGDRLRRLDAVGIEVARVVERGGDPHRVAGRDRQRRRRDVDRIRPGRGQVGRARHAHGVLEHRQRVRQHRRGEARAALEEVGAHLPGVAGDAEAAVGVVLGRTVHRVEAADPRIEAREVRPLAAETQDLRAVGRPGGRRAAAGRRGGLTPGREDLVGVAVQVDVDAGGGVRHRRDQVVDRAPVGEDGRHVGGDRLRLGLRARGGAAVGLVARRPGGAAPRPPVEVEVAIEVDAEARAAAVVVRGSSARGCRPRRSCVRPGWRAARCGSRGGRAPRWRRRRGRRRRRSTRRSAAPPRRWCTRGRGSPRSPGAPASARRPPSW